MAKKKKPFYKKAWFIILAAFVMISVIGNSGDDSEKIEWNDIELSRVLSAPQSDEGKILSNSDDRLSIYIHDTSKSDYNDYVSECQSKGFIIESDKSDNRYSAYNADGYELDLWYNDNDEKLHITLAAPMEMESLRWPTSEIVSLLPIPKSNVGNIINESSDGFFVYIGNTSLEDYDTYVSECSASGFSVDYDKGDKYYHADNTDGYHISLNYQGNNVMSIEIVRPEEEKLGATDGSLTKIDGDTTNTQEPTAPPIVELPGNSTFAVHFIDVGQADAALVECDGHYMLIDGGNKGDSNVIYTVLKNAGVSKLDIAVGTHAHEDHIGGIPGAFNYTTADLTLCPETSYDSDAFDDFVKYANEKGGGITVPSVGDSYVLGSATVTILGVNGGNDTNDTSIVLKVQYGETSFLFTGDAEREAEQAILNSGADLSATVLKVGHHGSDTSTTYPFLREIMPSYAVISVGKDNSYDHPTDNTLSRLRDADVEVYRTDLHGDIIITSDGKAVSISTDKQASSEDIMTPGGSTAVTLTPTPEPTSEPIPEPTPEPTPEPIPEPEPEPNQSSGTCWKSATGDKYHSINNCGRMNPNKATQLTIEQAESMGLGRCSKCW